MEGIPLIFSPEYASQLGLAASAEPMSSTVPPTQNRKVSKKLRRSNAEARRDDKADIEDDDDDPKAQSGSMMLLLPCPFYKWNKKKYMNCRSRHGPGWPSLRRLMEHLYRKHLLPPHHCPRCKEYFSEKSELERHQTAGELCEVRDYPAAEGITSEQQELLKSRKRARGTKTPEAKWREIYKILRPGTEDKDVPSPYYDDEAHAEAAMTDIMREMPHEAALECDRQLAGMNLNVGLLTENLKHWMEDQIRKRWSRSVNKADAPIVSLVPSLLSGTTVSSDSLAPSAEDNLEPHSTGLEMDGDFEKFVYAIDSPDAPYEDEDVMGY